MNIAIIYTVIDLILSIFAFIFLSVTIYNREMYFINSRNMDALAARTTQEEYEGNLRKRIFLTFLLSICFLYITINRIVRDFPPFVDLSVALAVLIANVILFFLSYLLYKNTKQ